MARIVTVYMGAPRPFVPSDMSYIRWWKISEELARCGHEVEIAANDKRLWRRHFRVRVGPNLWRVPLRRVRWERYDVVKTLFNLGYDTLRRYGGVGHPFVISKLGSVVDAEDRDGVYFQGEQRERMYQAQQGIAASSRYVTLLTPQSRDRWIKCFGDHGNTLLVPGAVDDAIPAPTRDPYAGHHKTRCIFAGNIYHRRTQPRAHALLVEKINRLGELLTKRSIRLYVLGPGDKSGINADLVTCREPVPYDQCWDYFHFAQVGIVLALGDQPNENESSKIYHYLRAGLPTVCESGFPNQSLINEAKLGAVVANGDMAQMADAIDDAAHRNWQPDFAIRYIRQNHTWQKRVQIYDRLIRAECDPGGANACSPAAVR
jgi:hypothetical protein